MDVDLNDEFDDHNSLIALTEDQIIEEMQNDTLYENSLPLNRDYPIENNEFNDNNFNEFELDQFNDDTIPGNNQINQIIYDNIDIKEDIVNIMEGSANEFNNQRYKMNELEEQMERQRKEMINVFQKTGIAKEIVETGHIVAAPNTIQSTANLSRRNNEAIFSLSSQLNQLKNEQNNMLKEFNNIMKQNNQQILNNTNIETQLAEINNKFANLNREILSIKSQLSELQNNNNNNNNNNNESDIKIDNNCNPPKSLKKNYAILNNRNSAKFLLWFCQHDIYENSQLVQRHENGWDYYIECNKNVSNKNAIIFDQMIEFNLFKRKEKINGTRIIKYVLSNSIEYIDVVIPDQIKNNPSYMYTNRDLKNDKNIYQYYNDYKTSYIHNSEVSREFYSFIYKKSKNTIIRNILNDSNWIYGTRYIGFVIIERTSTPPINTNNNNNTNTNINNEIEIQDTVNGDIETIEIESNQQ